MRMGAIFLCMPRRGSQVCAGAARAFYGAKSARGLVYRATAATSLLTYSFNSLWCQALNDRERHGIAYFAMIHADIEPVGESWVDVLIDELERLGADVVSAVVPQRGDGGRRTSTAIEGPDPWAPQVIAAARARDLPETFGSDAGGDLLVNTGLWVCDFRKPWVEEVCFTIRDRIVRGEGGVFQAQVRPEDWEFSRDLRARGAKLYATRKVQVTHHGERGFTFP